MSLIRKLLGRRLRTAEQEENRIGPWRGVAVLGLDALSSAGYGPEAALTVLLGLGAAATTYIGPISAAIVLLLLIVFASYRQTIAAYPNGGGSYVVASENLGRIPGLLAASALSLDYVLNVAVGIAAGVGAIVSAIPELLPHTLALCLAILLLITLANLRGVRETGFLFMVPTVLFVATLGLTIMLGAVKALLAHGHPVPMTAPYGPSRVTEVATVWLFLRAFASGCTAMTGVEAVSNAVPIFRAPAPKMAARTLTAIVLILAFLLAGIAYLCIAYGVVATPPGEEGYQSVLSQLAGAVTGRGVLYSITMAAVVAVLCLSANTSFAGFPRLSRLLAADGFLPAEFARLGRRLVYSFGIMILALFSGVLLIAFGGITDRLIPLFAIGAFLAFTLSQAGMVVHWRRVGGGSSAAKRAGVVNAVGAAATGVTLAVIVISKFTEGAWISLLVIPACLTLYLAVRRDYDRVALAVGVDAPVPVVKQAPPVIVVPMRALNRVVTKAIAVGVGISPDVRVVHVKLDDSSDDDLEARWKELVANPLRGAGSPVPQLVTLRSAYREFFNPILSYVRQLEKELPDRNIAVIVPELIERRWYHFLIHSHRPTILKALLLLRGGPRVLVINAPWYLGTRDDGDAVGQAAGR